MAHTITSNRSSEFELNSSDTGDNPLTIAAGVTVSVGSGQYAIYSSYFQSWNITNLGTLLAKYGVLLNDGDTSPGSVLTNSGTAALISGTDIGVEVFGSFSTVTNQGTILGGSGDGVDLDADSDSVTNSGGAALIQGGRDGVYANATPNATAVVTNFGTISGTSGNGVFLTGGGSVTNGATTATSALIEGGTNGVAAAGTSTAVVTNFGTINGASGDGVSLAAGGKVTNSGTGAAIYGGANAVYATNASAVVVNTGLIEATSTGSKGVYLDAGGTVTNNSTLAVIDGYVYGVRVNGAAGTVTNLGRIIGNVAGVDFLHGGRLANNGTAALVSGLIWGAYFGASGGAVTVTNQGTILGKGGFGVNLGDGGALTNSGTGALISGADYGVVASGQYLTLVNTGRIIGSSGGGVYLGAGATLTNSATARIDGAASGILANNNPIYVVNQGTIAGTGTSSVGVELEAGGTLTNSGTGALIYGTTIGIQAIVKPFTLVNYAKISASTGVGAYFGAGGSVTNGATAQIDGATYGVLASNSAIGVVNQGTIVGTTKDGVYLKDGGTVANSGTAALISGDFGIKVRGGAATVTNQGSIVGATNAGVYIADGGTVTNSATGQLDGDANGVVGLDFAIGVVNQGSIAGTTKAGIYLQDGGTVTNSGTAARISGAKYGINVHNDAATVSNQGSIVGTTSDGVYLAAGGTVTNSGTAAVISGATYGIKIESGAATIIDRGTISGPTAAVQFANVSGNVLELYPDATLSGKVKGSSTTGLLVLASGSAAGIISGISSQYTGFGAFDVDAGAHWTLSGSNTIAKYATVSLGAFATLTVSGRLVSLGNPTLEGGGTIVLSGTGAIEVGTNASAIAGQFFIDSKRTVVTDGSVSLGTVLSHGTVVGMSGYGLFLGSGGTVTNFADGRISAVDDGIAAKGTASVDNLGSITGTNNAGVYLGVGGSVTNSGTGALISGGKYGIRATGSAAAVANFGGISASDDGVYLLAGGSVTNSGTAALISGFFGVKASSPATVTNQGTIAGVNIGVFLTSGGTVIDSGTLVGQKYAVLFFEGNANRLVVDPGAVFSGRASGANPIVPGTETTLELAAGAGAGTFAGLGSQYVNFAQTTIDAGASWTLTGYNSLASGATLTNSGTLTLSGATLTDSGVLINDGGITLDPSTLTVGSLLGNGVVAIATGGTLEVQGTIASSETIAFAGSNAELHLDAPDSVSGSVTNVSLGDLIDLQGIAPGSVRFANGTLSFAGGSFAVSLNGTPAVQAVASADGTVFEVVGPVITGTAADQPVTDTTTVDPFSGVAITDSNAGQTETVTVTLSNDTNGTLSNLGTGSLNNGVYTDTGTADQVTTALQDLVFTPAFDPGPLGHTIATTFTLQATDTAGAVATDSTTSVVASAAPFLVTLATFTGNGPGNGANPFGGLVADSSGDLFGTTKSGGADSDGTLFEIAKSAGVFASSPTTLVTFDGTGNGALPEGGLITDAGGDLLGTTAGGGANGAGTVFQLSKTGPSNYAGAPTTLVTFSDTSSIGYRPVAGVIADSAGDLFGTVDFPGGANDGAVFEIANGTTTLTQVVGFTSFSDGLQPEGPLLLDAAGDLFGTTNTGGAGGQGTVFEIAYNGTSYATTATTLVTFNGGNGANPLGGLVADANGDLFGTTSSGGADGDGTVFEIANKATGYATTATTLVNFDGAGDGANPAGTLLIDSDGYLYGATQNGGASGDGTVFEIAHTNTGYATSPTTLATFDGTGNGANPYAGLVADPAGDLFGTTQNGGASGDGTAFEVVSTGADFAPVISGTAANQAVTDAGIIQPFSAVTITDPKFGQTETLTVTLSNAANGTLLNLSGGNFSDGVYTDTGTAAQVTTALDGLVFQPTDHQVPPGQTVTTTFTIADTDTFGATATDSTTSVVATAVAVPVTITGTAADQPATDRSTIDPFSNVTISDPNAGQTETVTLTQSDTANGTLSNLGGFTATGTPGVYTDTNTATQVTTDLQGLVFTPTFYPGVVGATATTGFTLADTDTARQNATDSTTSVIATAVPILTTLVTFDNSGENPDAGLIADRAGDLFGTTNSYGTVFEIARTGVGTYATTPTTLVTFTEPGTAGLFPQTGLIADAAGDLFGTAQEGGDGFGTVFEVAKTTTGYATTATALIAFNGSDGANPYDSLIDDAAGDLFGATDNLGPGNDGTVFEIAKTATGYATTPTTLVSFNGTGNGAHPYGDLIADAAGDLFGATESGGAGGNGTVFEIAKTATGYATSPTTLVAFASNGSEGSTPLGALITDANGDLFGTTIGGGAGGGGTVFEVENTATGYASTPITLASFNGGNGSSPGGGLIADAAGDLFGITSGGGADSDGTVFEIANTATGYATTPITLASFDGTGNGAYPYGDLLADSAGDLFGTTSGGGATGDGTAFELTDTGLTFAPVISGTQAGQLVTDATTVDPFADVTITDGNSGQTETVTVTLSNALNGTLTGLGNGSYAAGTYTDTGTAAQVTGDLDGLVFTPTEGQVPVGQTVTTIFTLDDVDTANATATDTTTSVIATAAPKLTTLFTFNGTLNGADPLGGLLADANGDLFGMTVQGGADKDGTVFELVRNGGAYASTPTTLVTFAGTSNGKSPTGGLFADAAGDLFGETQAGGASSDGTVFEIVNNGTAYATSPTTLATFANGGTPFGGLIMNAAGDLLGTTSNGGADNDGTVFEIASTGTSYAGPTTLVTFDGTGNGATPKAGLLADAAGDLFGTTNAGGADGDGTVFEIANTITGYATSPTTVATFTGADTGAEPFGSLITDDAGDLFGVTQAGGADGHGTVFELQNTATGYAATPITLLTFDGAGNGAIPGAALIADATGDLFGTTESGGADGDGTVFELAKTATGYAATPTTLVTFSGAANGSDPRANLLADAAGDLFGTTENGGTDNDGTLFELTDTGLTFAPVITGTAASQTTTDLETIHPFTAVTITDGNSGQTETVTVTLSSAANGKLSSLGGGSFNAGAYTDTGTAAQVTEALRGLVFTPTAAEVAPGQTVTTTFTIADTDTATGFATDSTTTVVTTDTGPRNLVWTGAADGAFASAGNWDDTTFGHNPALWNENATDSVAFGASGGAITGTDTAAAVSFSGGGAWQLDSAASLRSSGRMTVGATQSASLQISAGASLIETGAPGAVIAAQAGSGGSAVNVSGLGSSWEVGGALDVGEAASGALEINAGGGVTAASIDAGVLANSAGVITVADAGSALTTTGSFTVGDNGAGELSILNGASVSVGGDLDVGQSADGSGNVDIENASLTVAGNLNLGLGGNAGVLTVGTGGFLQVDGGLIGGPDSVLNEFGDPVSTFDDGVNTNVGASETQDFTAYIDDFASFTIDAGVTLTLETPSIYDDVALVLGGRRDTTGDELILNAGSVSADTTVMFNNKFGTLVLGTDTLGTIDIQANDTAAATLVANPDLGVPTIANFDGVIENFTGGDRVVVDTDGAATFSVNGSVVSVIQNGNPVGTLTVDVASGTTLTAADFVDNALCFLAGTLIGTPAGPVPVERLAIGDAVLTASGTVRPIVWIGSGQVLVTRGRRSAATPVIVRKGALAKNVPHRDLHVTKGHSLYIDDVLIPVEFLVNHRSILWDDRAQEVTLCHVELETHDVLLANGAPAESYRDDGNRWLFHNANSRWDQPAKPPCAPVLTGGLVVDAVWRRLLDRAGARPGVPLTDDPDLHLMVDGQRVDGARRPNGYRVFKLPRHPSELRVVSRAGSPAELGLARDPRVLGVAVRQIRLWEGKRLRLLDASDEALIEGFHAFEPDNGFRWTDGDAALPKSLFAGITGVCRLELLVGGRTKYAKLGMPPARNVA